MAGKIPRSETPKTSAAATESRPPHTHDKARIPFDRILGRAEEAARTRGGLGDGNGLGHLDGLGLGLGDGGGDGREAPDPLAPFTPPPTVLGDVGPSGRVAVSAAASDPTARALAELRAMADRMVTSMSLGRRGDGHALKMKLSLGQRGRVGVSLALRDDDLEITLAPETVTRADALSLAATVERELGVRVSID